MGTNSRVLLRCLPLPLPSRGVAADPVCNARVVARRAVSLVVVPKQLVSPPSRTRPLHASYRLPREATSKRRAYPINETISKATAERTDGSIDEPTNKAVDEPLDEPARERTIPSGALRLDPSANGETLVRADCGRDTPA